MWSIVLFSCTETWKENIPVYCLAVSFNSNGCISNGNNPFG